MSFVAPERLQIAVDSLRRFHPFFGVTFLSMKRSDLPVGTMAEWQDEKALLDAYYAPLGAPPSKKYFIPFGNPDAATGYWRNPKASDGNLQSARTRQKFKDGLLHTPNTAQWGFAPNYLQVFADALPVAQSGRAAPQPIKIPTLDLAAWLYASEDLPEDFDQLVDRFRRDFHIDDATYATLFDDSRPPEVASFFAAEPITTDELAQITKGIPEGASLRGRSEGEILAEIERHIAGTSKLDLPPNFVRNFYYTLKTQRFAVLAGRAGTGKTEFARALADALGAVFPDAVHLIVVPIGEDYGESEALGYARIAGGLEATELTKEVFLSNRKHDFFVVVLDEMNLSHADHYLARVLPAVESGLPVQLPGLEGHYRLPPDTFFIGTINSYLEEPNRLPLTGPVKRRSNIVEMPNWLEQIARSGDRGRFVALMRLLLNQTLARYRKLGEMGESSALDAFRIADLEAALTEGAPLFSDPTTALLWDIVGACSTVAQTSLTAGVLQDVIEFVALAHDLPPFEAIDIQVAQKVVPQISGPERTARELLDVLGRHATEEHHFPMATAAIQDLLNRRDPSGTVFFQY